MTLLLLLLKDRRTNTDGLSGRINGLGKHRATLSPGKVATFVELLYFFQIFYVLGPPSVKLALLFLYRRIFEHSSFLRIVDGMIVMISVWAIIMTFLAIFNCKPISDYACVVNTCISIIFSRQLCIRKVSLCVFNPCSRHVDTPLKEVIHVSF